jgi:glycosyltransferase involved in cell wall biosynthesis
LRIIVTSSEFPPINAAASARIEPWVKELASRGHQVKVFSSKGSKPMRSTEHYASPFSVPSNKVGIFRRFLQEMRLARDLGSMVRSLSDKPHALVITSPPFFMATHIAKIAKEKNIPYLFDIRDRYPKVLFDLKVIPENGFIGNKLIQRENFCYQNSRLLTTVTEGIDSQLKDFQRPHAHLPNGFDGELFDISKFPKKDDLFRIVYHGRFSRLHDVEALRKISLRVKELNPRIEFMIIGPIPESYKINKWGNVCFVGEKKREEIPALLATGSLGISLMKEMTSTKVAMPAKVYEYIGMGLPLVVAPAGELYDFVKMNKIGLSFKKMNVMEMANEIFSLEQDCQKYSEFQENLLSIKSRFDRRTQSIIFADLVEQHFNVQNAKKVSLN